MLIRAHLAYRNMAQLERTYSQFCELLKVVPPLEEHMRYVKKRQDSVEDIAKFVSV